MAYIRGSPQEPRSSEEASEEEAESDEALARRLQAEEQGRPVARFKQMDRVEARYRDPNHRGGAYSPKFYLATVIDVIAPKTQKRSHEYMLRWDDGSEVGTEEGVEDGNGEGGVVGVLDGWAVGTRDGSGAGT